MNANVNAQRGTIHSCGNGKTDVLLGERGSFAHHLRVPDLRMPVIHTMKL